VNDPDSCPEGRGFIPGRGIVACELFNTAGQPLRKIYIVSTQAREWHCTPDAAFVRCTNEDMHPEFPQNTPLPLCPFIGASPRCLALDGTD